MCLFVKARDNCNEMIIVVKSKKYDGTPNIQLRKTSTYRLTIYMHLLFAQDIQYSVYEIPIFLIMGLIGKLIRWFSLRFHHHICHMHVQALDFIKKYHNPGILFFSTKVVCLGLSLIS